MVCDLYLNKSISKKNRIYWRTTTTTQVQRRVGEIHFHKLTEYLAYADIQCIVNFTESKEWRGLTGTLTKLKANSISPSFTPPFLQPHSPNK